MEELQLLWFFIRGFIGAIVLIVVISVDKNKRKGNYYQQNTNFYNRPNNPYMNFTGYHQPKSYAAPNSTESFEFQEPPMYPYKKKNVLTPTEYQFYTVLKQKCDANNLVVCPKVRLEDFIDVTTKDQRMKYRGYIKSRHVDFILCDSNMNIIAGIEVDDSSHNTVERRKIDDFKTHLFRKINIPLHRVPIGCVDFEVAADGIIRAYSLFRYNY